MIIMSYTKLFEIIHVPRVQFQGLRPPLPKSSPLREVYEEILVFNILYGNVSVIYKNIWNVMARNYFDVLDFDESIIFFENFLVIHAMALGNNKFYISYIFLIE